MALDLTGVSQQKLLTERRNGKPPTNPGMLTAIKALGRQKGQGIVWDTVCNCGKHREVPAQYFTSGRIKKCKTCVDPALAAESPKLIQRRVELEIERDEAGWYPEPFRSDWKAIYAEFTGMRRLLFEVTIGDRRRTNLFLMQSTDIVNRVPEGELDIELGTFSRPRVAAARRRLADQMEKSRNQ